MMNVDGIIITPSSDDNWNNDKEHNSYCENMRLDSDIKIKDTQYRNAWS